MWLTREIGIIYSRSIEKRENKMNVEEIKKNWMKWKRKKIEKRTWNRMIIESIWIVEYVSYRNRIIL